MRLGFRLCSKHNPFAKPDGGTVFFDQLRIKVKSGNGAKGWPWLGGVGGDGGDVYLISSTNRSYTLSRIAKENSRLSFSAKDGWKSSRHRVLGDKGADSLVYVPAGVSVFSVQENALQVLGDLVRNGQRLLVAKGGKGGCPENQFNGQPGEEKEILIDLKLLADVGFVGFPNAGKSTLLKAISNAEPAISFWPFTTMRPQISRLLCDNSSDERRSSTDKILIADLPGIIEGAHKNEGLGYAFLKHVERTLFMLFIVDINGFQLTPERPFRDAVETVLLLNKEIELYNPDLLKKPAILCLNKTDTDSDGLKTQRILQQLKELEGNLHRYDEAIRPKQLLKFVEIIPIAAKQPQSTLPLRNRLRDFANFFRAERQKLRRLKQQSKTPENSAESVQERLDSLCTDTEQHATQAQ